MTQYMEVWGGFYSFERSQNSMRLQQAKALPAMQENCLQLWFNQNVSIKKCLIFDINEKQFDAVYSEDVSHLCSKHSYRTVWDADVYKARTK